MHHAVTADHIMRAHLRTRERKGAQRLFAGILRRVMDNDEIGLAEVKIGGAHPSGRRNGSNGDISRLLFQNVRPMFALKAVHLVGDFVRVGRASAE